jgi:hypothetical protein
LLTLLVGLVTAPPLVDYEEHTMTRDRHCYADIFNPATAVGQQLLENIGITRLSA